MIAVVLWRLKSQFGKHQGHHCFIHFKDIKDWHLGCVGNGMGELYALRLMIEVSGFGMSIPLKKRGLRTTVKMNFCSSIVEPTLTIYGHTARVWDCVLTSEHLISTGEVSAMNIHDWFKTGRQMLHMETPRWQSHDNSQWPSRWSEHNYVDSSREGHMECCTEQRSENSCNVQSSEINCSRWQGEVTVVWKFGTSHWSLIMNPKSDIFNCPTFNWELSPFIQGLIRFSCVELIKRQEILHWVCQWVRFHVFLWLTWSGQCIRSKEIPKASFTRGRSATLWLRWIMFWYLDIPM